MILCDIPQAEVVARKFQNDANLYGALHCFLQEKGNAMLAADRFGGRALGKE